jgi:cytochrome d ubiquinol oxidase subunit I
MEGIWSTQRGAPAVLFAVPNEATKENDYEVAIPKLASLYLTHDIDGEVKGLDEFPNDHPPVKPVFYAFRVMVGVGMLMLFVSWISAWQLKRRGDPSPWVARALVGMTFSGWLAVLAGWYVTEIGRQPWLVTGVLRTADAASSTPAPIIGLSLSMYLAIYVGLILSYISVLFYLARKRKPVVVAADAPTVNEGEGV